MREDPRFRSVGPNVLELVDDDEIEELGEEDGLWFDYTFVEFLKTNYSKECKYRSLRYKLIALFVIVAVQRAILLDPNATSETGREYKINFIPSRLTDPCPLQVDQERVRNQQSC